MLFLFEPPVKSRNLNYKQVVNLTLPTDKVVRPLPVEAPFALGAFALDGVAVLVDGLKHLVSELRTPAFGRTHDPLHLLVAADLNERGLMTGADDDGVVGRVVVDGVNVRPVAAGACADDVAEVDSH